MPLCADAFGLHVLPGFSAIMTHASVPKERRVALGIDDNLIRLSVGIEHIDDILADVEGALAAVKTRLGL